MDFEYDKKKTVITKIEGRSVAFAPSPNVSGTLTNPSAIVAHYTGSGGTDGSGDVGWFLNAQSKVSAHFVVGRDGGVTQCVPLNKKSWHAGVSVWRGKPDCNGFTVGIEFDNWGLLTKRADGVYVSATGKTIPPASVVELPFGPGHPSRPWEIYTREQMDSGFQLVQVLRDLFPSINEVIGHQDIAPGRKTDPGPAFDMNRMRCALEGRIGYGKDRIAKVTATGLNVRGEPSTTAEVLGSIKLNDKVSVKYEASGWAYVSVKIGNAVRTGWVSSQYIAYE